MWLTKWWSCRSSSKNLVRDIIGVTGARHAVSHLHHRQLRAQARLTVHFLHRLWHIDRHHHLQYNKHCCRCNTLWCLCGNVFCVCASNILLWCENRARLTLSLSVGSFREYSLLVMSLPMRYLNTSFRKVSDSKKNVSLSRDQHRNLQFSSAIMVTCQS